MELSEINEERLRDIFKAFNRFMLFMWRLGFGTWGNGTKYGGSIMVVLHTGRKTGIRRKTPVNYATIKDDVYCVAAFGGKCDWYQNILADNRVEMWLPDGRWAGVAADVTGVENRADIFRQVIVASGFAGPLFGVNPKHLSGDDYEQLLGSYRLVRIRRMEAVAGPGGPGDLEWIWPLSTFVLLGLLLTRPAKRNR
jgi:deazaflavin-dependent oxidoreductase (nitroreductase family)